LALYFLYFKGSARAAEIASGDELGRQLMNSHLACRENHAVISNRVHISVFYLLPECILRQACTFILPDLLFVCVSACILPVYFVHCATIVICFDLMIIRVTYFFDLNYICLSHDSWYKQNIVNHSCCDILDLVNLFDLLINFSLVNIADYLNQHVIYSSLFFNDNKIN
jgi:hypothetical protein